MIFEQINSPGYRITWFNKKLNRKVEPDYYYSEYDLEITPDFIVLNAKCLGKDAEQLADLLADWMNDHPDYWDVNNIQNAAKMAIQQFSLDAELRMGKQLSIDYNPE